MQKIQRISVYILHILNLLTYVIPAYIILSWTFIDTDFIKYLVQQGFLHDTISTPDGFIRLNMVNWSITTQLIGFIASSISVAPIFLSLFCLKSIFSNYRNGNILVLENSKNYNKLGWLFFCNALLAKPISDCLMEFAVSFANPIGHRYIAIGFGTPNVEALFCGVLVIIISWVMSEATSISSEHKLTI